jgi:ribosomal-protein-alanine N-acetyltransferase
MSAIPSRLVTKRFVLRPVAPTDAADLLVVRNHPNVIGSTAMSAEMSNERMELQIHRWLAVWDTRAVGTWVIELDGQVIGYVPLDPIGDEYADVGPDELELGVVVHPDHWGQGIAGEAGLAVAVDCFGRGQLPHVFATVDLDNDQSLAVIAKVPGAELLTEADGERLYRFPNPSVPD